MISDLDLKSKHSQLLEWNSILKKGILKRLPSGNFTIFWDNNHIILKTNKSFNNRSMELSELIKWNNSLLSPCDSTGIVYEIDLENSKINDKWTFIYDNKFEIKPFKIEWCTQKDGNLYLGSIGKEWIENGKIINYYPEFVKTINLLGNIEHHDWSKKYHLLRNITKTNYPGYLIHEAVLWNPVIKKWIFLPRRESQFIHYSSKSELHSGSNILLIVDEYWEKIEIKRIGKHEPDWGFTSIKMIPDTFEFIALKVKEYEGNNNEIYFTTMITIFDINGNFKLQPMLVSDVIKFEGIEFL